MDQETKDRIVELRKKGGEIWSELRMLESEEWADEHKHLEGKYLKGKNSYGRDDEDGIQEWNTYFKVLEIKWKDKRILVEEFEETVRSEIMFKITTYLSHISNYEVITEEEYETARKILISKLTDGPSAYNTGKIW